MQNMRAIASPKMKQTETKWKTIEKEPEGSVFFCGGIRRQAAIALKELSYSGKQNSRLGTGDFHSKWFYISVEGWAKGTNNIEPLTQNFRLEK